MTITTLRLATGLAFGAALILPSISLGQLVPPTDALACSGLPLHGTLLKGLFQEVRRDTGGGFGNDMWATIVSRDGRVCAVAFSGEDKGAQWAGSRVISAQKANTARAFSLSAGARGAASGLSLSTANLYAATQPQGPLFGLQLSNPVDTGVAYRGASSEFGKPNDPMLKRRVGGINVFAGGLALYAPGGVLMGGLGVSGDTSCADHIIAWRVRDLLALDNVPTGVSPTGDDNIIHDMSSGTSQSGWGHPECSPVSTAAAANLPTDHPIGP